MNLMNFAILVAVAVPAILLGHAVCTQPAGSYPPAPKSGELMLPSMSGAADMCAHA